MIALESTNLVIRLRKFYCHTAYLQQGSQIVATLRLVVIM